MFSIYNAPFIAYILLSCFEVVTDRERDVVRFILDLVASYNITTGQLPMTPNVDLLAQIYHVELRVLATLHSSHSEGSVDENLEAADLLSAVVLPIVQNATREEYAALLRSMGEAESLLTGPLETLNELAVTCKSRNHEPAISWPKSEPRAERPRLSQAISCKSSSSRSTPRSECSKELELLASSGSKKSKSRARSKTFHFSLPHFALGGRIIALDSGRTMDYERSKTASWYSTVDATFEKELQDIVENAPEMHCLCHTGHICFIHAEGHPSDYETKSDSPSRRKFTRNLRLSLKRILTSQSV